MFANKSTCREQLTASTVLNGCNSKGILNINELIDDCEADFLVILKLENRFKI